MFRDHQSPRGTTTFDFDASLCETSAVYITQLEHRLKTSFPAISAARLRTDELLGRLRSELSRYDDPAAAVIVTGSLGRGEVSESSDADWMLLVDGQSNVQHATALSEVAAAIDGMLKKPGSTGTFGTFVSSHDLVQYIAGTRDTNENLTRRMLLLAESKALTGGVVRERVLRNVLTRYIVSDRSVPRSDGKPYPIPHFLLNDVVRYWRTMASDYASKMWERRGKGWGIRNIKLRFSRKLLFVWGLLAAFSAKLFPSEALVQLENDPQEYYLQLVEHVLRCTAVTPLELLARVVMQQASDETALLIFSSYNQFLLTLSDPEKREALERVTFEESETDPIYASLRGASRDFRNGINSLFFDNHSELAALIRQYGVF